MDSTKSLPASRSAMASSSPDPARGPVAPPAGAVPHQGWSWCRLAAATTNSPPTRPTFFQNWIRSAFASAGSSSRHQACAASVVGTINPATVTKLADRGSSQARGIVTDVGLFLEQLAAELVPEYRNRRD